VKKSAAGSLWKIGALALCLLVATALMARAEDAASLGSYEIPGGIKVFTPGADAGGAGHGEEIPQSVLPDIPCAKCSDVVGICACVADDASFCDLEACPIAGCVIDPLTSSKE
jgi:hypothetical protein